MGRRSGNRDTGRRRKGDERKGVKGAENLQANVISEICWSYHPPPTPPWFPGNHTCFRLVVLPGTRSHSDGRKAYRGSSSASAWNAFSTLLDTCVLVKRHVLRS